MELHGDALGRMELHGVARGHMGLHGSTTRFMHAKQLYASL